MAEKTFISWVNTSFSGISIIIAGTRSVTNQDHFSLLTAVKYFFRVNRVFMYLSLKWHVAKYQIFVRWYDFTKNFKSRQCAERNCQFSEIDSLWTKL